MGASLCSPWPAAEGSLLARAQDGGASPRPGPLAGPRLSLEGRQELMGHRARAGRGLAGARAAD